jgi:hypothetical protein
MYEEEEYHRSRNDISNDVDETSCSINSTSEERGTVWLENRVHDQIRGIQLNSIQGSQVDRWQPTQAY